MGPSPRVRSSSAGALALVAALALAACDDGPAGPKPPAAGGPRPGAAAEPGPAPVAMPVLPDGPPEATVDDAFVARAVVASASGAGPLPDDLAKLPPRVSPVRVAVRVLHEHFLDAPGAAGDLPALLDALGALAAGDRTTVDRGALGPLVATWRTWTVAQVEGERKLAERVVQATSLLAQADDVDRAAVAALLRDPPRTGAKSPAAAAHRACEFLLAVEVTPGHEMPAALADALEAARAAYADLGWPGGFGPYLEIAAVRLAARSDGPTLRAATVQGALSQAYRDSGDALRVALVVQSAAEAALRAGDGRRAAGLAKDAVERVRATGARGAELVGVLETQGRVALATSDPAAALAALDAAAAEIAWARLSPVDRARVEERRATSLWFLGRYEDALRAADAGAAAFDAGVMTPSPADEVVRASLDEVAASTLLDAGRASEAARRSLAQARRLDRIEGGATHAAVARARAAEAHAKAGETDAARALVQRVLGDARLRIQARAQCAIVFRALGDFDAAASLLDAVEKEGGQRAVNSLAIERAWLAASRGDRAAARAEFDRALGVAAGGDPSRVAGLGASRVCLDRARFEESQDDLVAAAHWADQAIFHLTSSAVAADLDRARRAWVSLQRRLLHFADAARVAADRLAAGPPGGDAARLDAEIDLALARMELASSGSAGARRALAATADAVVLELVRRLVPEFELPATGVTWAGDAGVPPRVQRLLDAAAVEGANPARLLAFAANLPREEPELRRWALRRAAERSFDVPDAIDWSVWIDRFRGAVPVTSEALAASLPEGVRFLALEAYGAHTVILDATSRGVSARLVPGDLGLDALRLAVATGDLPEQIRAAASNVCTAADGVLGKLLAERPGESLVLSVAAPDGPIPGDLLVRAGAAPGATLIDEREVLVAASHSDWVAAAARPAPPDSAAGTAPPVPPAPPGSPAPAASRLAPLAVVTPAGAPLAARHGVAVLFPVDESDRRRFLAMVDEARSRGLGVSAALRDAKLRLRAEAAADPKPHPGVPLWARFALRGAP